MSKIRMIDKLKEYHFQLKHLTVIFMTVFAFQLIVSLINKSSMRAILGNAQEWYEKDSVEKTANLTTTSFELLLESVNPDVQKISPEQRAKIIKAFDILFTQQLFQRNTEKMCILVKRNDRIYAVDDGNTLFGLMFLNSPQARTVNASYGEGIQLFDKVSDGMISDEQIKSVVTNTRTFNTFVPMILRGEYVGAVYIEDTPNLSFMTSEIISNADQTSLIYLSLISLALLSMYFISSYTVKERDEAQKLLLAEHESNIKKQVINEKELAFTRRIYRTHHKAEKIVSFIRGDLAMLSPSNIDQIKYRVSKYANFVSRIIYDMKWYDPPIQTIRSPIFCTNINEVIGFIVNHIFLRSSRKSGTFEIEFVEGKDLPPVPINEFVIWEIIEPLVQNSIEHGNRPDIRVNIKTSFHPETGMPTISIRDNGVGILPDLLEPDENGVKKLFHENVSTKEASFQSVGYGCYIAFEMAKRCGWDINAVNFPEGGCEFTITIKN
ncbi:MAG TPA: ATP-binding protein [Candidatus Acidoferrales bacterium]|nr:ATP-binding protein [Candidatus Acidoferrales bacterium]